MKPGMSHNVDNPSKSQATGLADASQVARGSYQDAATAQLSANPNRMRPAQQEASEGGHSEVWRDGVMANQTSDKTASQKTVYAARKKIFT